MTFRGEEFATQQWARMYPARESGPQVPQEFNRGACIDGILTRTKISSRAKATGTTRLEGWRIGGQTRNTLSALVNANAQHPFSDNRIAEYLQTAGTEAARLREESESESLSSRDTRRLSAHAGTLEVTAEILDEIRLNVGMHSIDRNTFIPASLTTLSEDSAEREAQITGDVTFLKLFGSLPGGQIDDKPHDAVVAFRDELQKRSSEPSAENAEPYIPQVTVGQYLDHVSECAGEPSAIHTRNEGLRDGYLRLAGLHLSESEPIKVDGKDVEAATREVLADPLDWMRIRKIIQGSLVTQAENMDRESRLRVTRTDYDGHLASWMDMGLPILKKEAEFLKETGIDRVFIMKLDQAVEGIEDKKKHRLVASAALAAVYLDAKGMIDVGSEHFAALFREVLPEFPQNIVELMQGEAARLRQAKEPASE